MIDLIYFILAGLGFVAFATICSVGALWLSEIITGKTNPVWLFVGLGIAIVLILALEKLIG